MTKVRTYPDRSEWLATAAVQSCAGPSLNNSEGHDLEEALAKEPSDLLSRFKLLGYYRGRISKSAAKYDDVESAKSYLLKAGRYGFRSDMRLANELLSRGEKTE
jgi:hypothetical protein